MKENIISEGMKNNIVECINSYYFLRTQIVTSKKELILQSQNKVSQITIPFKTQ